MKYTYYPLLLLSIVVFSQKNQTLDEVIVTDTKIDIPFSKKFRSVEIISRNEIRNAGVLNIVDLLQLITGLDIRRRGVSGIQADLYIRGGGFDQTLLLVDGMKMDDSQTGHHTLNMLLPIDIIERVEIIKGPAARIFGQNAFNGAINIITKKTKRTRKKELSFVLNRISYGSFNNFTSSVSARVSNNNYASIINYSKDDSGGYRHNTDFKTDNVFIKSSLSKKNPNTSFIATLTNRKFGANGFYASPDATEQYEKTQTSLIGLKSLYKKGNLIVKPKLYWRRNQDEYIYIRDNPSIYRNLHKTNKIAFETSFNYFSGLGKTNFGVDISSVSISSNNLGKHNRFITSIYLDHSFNLFNKRLNISPGFSISYFSDLSLHSFPGIDLGFDINEKIIIYGNFGKTYRIPTYTDLYYSDRTTVGNPELEPESAVSSEIGLKLNYEKIIIKASLFSRKSKNIIDYSKENEDDLWRARNIGKLQTDGFEIDLKMKVNKNFNFKFGYALINDDNFQSNINFSRYALNSLKHNVISNLYFKYNRKLSHSIQLRFAERTDGTSYKIINSNISFVPFSNDSQFFLNLNNIFNEYYWETNLVPMPGQNFTVGYKSSF